MGVTRILHGGRPTESYRGYSPDCQLNIVGCLLTKRLTKGGSRALQDPPGFTPLGIEAQLGKAFFTQNRVIQCLTMIRIYVLVITIIKLFTSKKIAMKNNKAERALFSSEVIYIGNHLVFSSIWN